MKVIVGTANFNKGASAEKTRITSVRLTKALMKHQSKPIEEEDFDLAAAWAEANGKPVRLKGRAKSSPRRDVLAEAKVVAVSKNWKGQEIEDEETEPSIQLRLQKRKPGPRSQLRRDLLAEAKKAATLKEWKDRS